MAKKILIILIAVLIVGAITYLIIANPFGWQIGTPPATGVVIVSLSLESFPAGTQMGPGLNGTKTTSIKIGEIVALSGEIITNGYIDSSVKIYQGENLLLEQSCVVIKASGGFGCGLEYPQTYGAYTLRFYTAGTEAESLDFTVVE